MEHNEGELRNGLKWIHQEVSHSKLSHVGVFVNVGTRDETAQQGGFAHFLEHVLFKGTHKRKSFHVLNRIDSVGGELNAYTTKEETVIYASVLKTHTARALELMADILFNANFPAQELEKEKEVVVDEIQSYLDSPYDSIFEEFESLLFNQHPLARDILGTVKEVKQIKRADLLTFVQKYYIPNNMVVSYCGGMSVKKFSALLERFFGEIPEGPSISRVSCNLSPQVFTQDFPKSNYQYHCVKGNLAYDYYHPKRLALLLLTNYLGGPAMNARLNIALREKHGIAYNIECNYTPFRDAGIFSLYFGTEQKQLAKAQKIIAKELKILCEKPLGSMQLHYAKQQFIGFLALNEENLANKMLNLGKSKLIFNQIDSVENSIKKIDDLNVQLLQDIANELMLPDHLSTLCYSIPN